MRSDILLFSMAFTVLCSGCDVVSLHPLYSPEAIVSDRDLEGLWADIDRVFEKERSTWTLKVDGKNEYAIRVDAPGTETPEEYRAVLVRIGKDRYLDLRSMPTAASVTRTSIAPHAFLRLRKAKDRLRLEPIDRHSLEAAMKAHPGVIDAETVDYQSIGSQLVLTSKTSMLQRFFEVYGDKIMGKPIYLDRKPSIEVTPATKAPE